MPRQWQVPNCSEGSTKIKGRDVSRRHDRNKQMLLKTLVPTAVLILIFQAVGLLKLKQKGAFRLEKHYTVGDNPESFDPNIKKIKAENGRIKEKTSDEIQSPKNNISDEEIMEGRMEVLMDGSAYGDDSSSIKRIFLVVSHCSEVFPWLEEFTKGIPIYNMTVISKCESRARGPAVGNFTTITRLPNVGRCDHNYAWWMARMASELDDDDVVIFMKANREIHQAAHPRKLAEMIRIASVNGFGCWLRLGRSMSAYHNTRALSKFTLGRYMRKLRDDTSTFSSQFQNMGGWLSEHNIKLPKPFTQVCYGGTFVAKGSSIKKQGSALWSRIEQSLTRGDNIEEGHFAERSWAGLLSHPPNKENVTNLLEQTDIFHKMGKNGLPYAGVLAKKLIVAGVDELENIWKGGVDGGNPFFFSLDRVHVVVSHCAEDISWIPQFFRQFMATNITVISKCDTSPDILPENASVVRLDNVGRCDHTYAWWMARYAEDVGDDDIVVFLKANKDDVHQYARSRTLTEMFRLASVQGFGCWLYLRGGMSAYHDTEELLRFSKGEYQRKERDNTDIFSSRWKSMKEWLESVGGVLPEPETQVCYGGTFVVRGAQMKGRTELWRKMEESLERGDNIEEGHFAERAWAGLLSELPSESDLRKLRRRAKIYKKMGQFGRPYKGVLVNKEQPGTR